MIGRMGFVNEFIEEENSHTPNVLSAFAAAQTRLKKALMGETVLLVEDDEEHAAPRRTRLGEGIASQAFRDEGDSHVGLLQGGVP